MKNYIWKIFEVYGLIITLFVSFISLIYTLLILAISLIILVLFSPFMLRDKELVSKYYLDLVKVAFFTKK